MDLETPIQWLSEHLSYPDNFLHICLLPDKTGQGNASPKSEPADHPQTETATECWKTSQNYPQLKFFNEFDYILQQIIAYW